MVSTIVQSAAVPAQAGGVDPQIIVEIVVANSIPAVEAEHVRTGVAKQTPSHNATNQRRAAIWPDAGFDRVRRPQHRQPRSRTLATHQATPSLKAPVTTHPNNWSGTSRLHQASCTSHWVNPHMVESSSEVLLAVGLPDTEIALRPSIDISVCLRGDQLEIQPELAPPTVKGSRDMVPLAVLDDERVLADVVGPPIVQDSLVAPLAECIDLVLSSVHSVANHATVGIALVWLDPSLKGILALPQGQPETTSAATPIATTSEIKSVTAPCSPIEHWTLGSAS